MTPELIHQERQFLEASQEGKLPLGLELAMKLSDHGAFERAIEVLELIRPLATTDDETISVLRLLGEAHLRLSSYQKAYLCLGEALTILSTRPSSIELFQVYYDIAWMFLRQGYLDNARSYLEGARMAIEGIADGDLDKQKAELLHITGLIEAAAGNHDLALANLRMEAGYRQKLGEKHRLAAVHNKLASVCYTQGDITTALENQALTHSLAEEIGDEFRLALSHKNYGDIYYIIGDLPRALEHFRRSEALCRTLGNGLGQVFAQAAIGRILSSSEPSSAKGHLDRALDLARKLENRDREASILVDLAEWHCLQSRPEAAQESLRLASNIEMMRGQTVSPRHQVVLARALLLVEGLQGPSGAQRVLETLLSKPLRMDDEEMMALPELEAQARFLLAESFSRQGLRELAAPEMTQAIHLMEVMLPRIPSEYHQTFLSKPVVSKILVRNS